MEWRIRIGHSETFPGGMAGEGFGLLRATYWGIEEKAIDYFGKIRYTHCNDFIFHLADFFCRIIFKVLFRIL